MGMNYYTKRWIYKEKDDYKGGEVVTLATERVTEPDIIVKVIHIQHQSSNSILTPI